MTKNQGGEVEGGGTRQYKQQKYSNSNFKDCNWSFPGGSAVKNLPANAGDTNSIPGPGRSHTLRSNS